MAAKKPPAPAGLGLHAEALWKRITKLYELRPDELRILEDACREADLIDRLEKELTDADLVVHGSQGQPVANPLVSEIRQHRTALRSMLAGLKLPDEDGRAQLDRSTKARAAANERWRRG